MASGNSIYSMPRHRTGDYAKVLAEN